MPSDAQRFRAERSGPGNVDDGWRFRAFRPRREGDTAVEEVVSGRVRGDGVGQWGGGRGEEVWALVEDGLC